MRITFASYNGSDNELSGSAGDVAQNLGELNVHLEQSLLHMQDMWTAVLNKLCPVPQQSAQGNQVGFRSKRVS